MARRARDLTLRHFGRTVRLFSPLYLSDHCQNRCRYCGFSAARPGPRRRLDDVDIAREAKALAATGLRQVLLLTGDHRDMAGVDYVAGAARLCRPLLPSVSVEIFACSEGEYAALAGAGVEGVTLFQETYNESLYRELHPSGPKADYAWRLGAPDRAARAGMRQVGLGVLLGLDDWRRDVYHLALHARDLRRRHPGTTFGFSLPRCRPCANSENNGGFAPLPVTDTDLAQALAALRLFEPAAPVTLSTREAAPLRDRLVPLGVTRLSAGVSTAVGGHAEPPAGEAQFEIADRRGVAEVAGTLAAMGYQAVYTDTEEP